MQPFEKPNAPCAFQGNGWTAWGRSRSSSEGLQPIAELPAIPGGGLPMT